MLGNNMMYLELTKEVIGFAIWFFEPAGPVETPKKKSKDMAVNQGYHESRLKTKS